MKQIPSIVAIWSKIWIPNSYKQKKEQLSFHKEWCVPSSLGAAHKGLNFRDGYQDLCWNNLPSTRHSACENKISLRKEQDRSWQFTTKLLFDQPVSCTSLGRQPVPPSLDQKEPVYTCLPILQKLLGISSVWWRDNICRTAHSMERRWICWTVGQWCGSCSC